MTESKKTAKKTAKKAPAQKTAARGQPAKADKGKKSDNTPKVPLTQREARIAKLKLIRNIVLGVGAVIIFLLWFGMQPLRAGINYGICRSYVEKIIPYPKTFKITQYYEITRENSILRRRTSGSTIRIFYTHIDPYGGTRSDMIECRGEVDPVNGYNMAEIKINRKGIDEEALAKFNETIPGILAGKPNLIIPRPPKSDDLYELKRDP